MEAQLHSMSDYLDLNVIANTTFNVSSENLYSIADDTGNHGGADNGAPHYAMDIPQGDTGTYDDVANDKVYDSGSMDLVYKKASEDDDKSLGI